MDIYQLASKSHYAHSQQVAKISELLAHSMGYSEAEISVIKQVAALHDIGKSDIPQAILNKPAALTPEEYEIVKTHTTTGYKQIIEATQALSVAAIVCQQHHERLDGQKGYMGLKDREIHPYAKLIAVADVFDALFSRRSYKDPWDIKCICQYFREQAGKQFDSYITSLLLEAISKILPLYNNAATNSQEVKICLAHSKTI